MTQRLEFSVRGILLDIEGTTSSVHFVYEVMFPFVRRELETFLLRNWGRAELLEVLDQMARDAGKSSWDAWHREIPPVGESDGLAARQRALVVAETLSLMDRDVKATGLKQLQGLIWEAGFQSGELQADLYDDVPEALRGWNEQSLDVRVYSSGSVAAQRLFFGHTIVGNLLPLFRGHYDTTTGSKREAVSYERIAQAMRLDPGEILFLSDVVAELDAARTAGMQTALCRRPGNAEPGPHDHPELRSFSELDCSRPAE
jgi:enolase-phosphatase E1